MIEIEFSDLEHDFKKNPLFCLSKDYKEYLTTRRFSYHLKKAFGDLKDYTDWKNSLHLLGLKRVGIDFDDENDSLEELDQLDNYSEELCGISFNSILLGEIFLKNLGRKENYDIDFTFLPNPEMIIIRFLDKKFRKTRIKIKLVGRFELDYHSYSIINLALQQYFTDLFNEDNNFRPYSLFHAGEHSIERIFNAEEAIRNQTDIRKSEKEFLPVFREIIVKMLIEMIVYNYYRKKNAKN